MSHSGKFLYRLNDEEKRRFSFELSKDNIPNILIEYKNHFNETYQYIMNIFKKVFSGKKNNNQLCAELEGFINRLEITERNVLKQYKIILFYLKLANLDINNTDIQLEFESEEEKNKFMTLLLEREKYLIKFKENINKLEYLKAEFNLYYEKMMTTNENDNQD